MGEGIRHHHAAALALQAIVADGVGGVQGFLDVARLQPVQPLLCTVGPDPGEAVRLQFLAYRRAVGALHARRAGGLR